MLRCLIEELMVYSGKIRDIFAILFFVSFCEIPLILFKLRGVLKDSWFIVFLPLIVVFIFILIGAFIFLSAFMADWVVNKLW